MEGLVASLHDHGVPTWQDVRNLDAVPTEDRIRAVIRDDAIAAGILWLTPEVATSEMICRVEVPELVARAKTDPTFFIVPVLAGGLDFDEVDDLFAGIAHADELRRWNIRKVEGDPDASAVDVSRIVLQRRLALVHRELPPGAPINVALYTRVPPPVQPSMTLAIDWSRRLTPRPAPPQVWTDRLIPAIHAVSDAIRVHAPGRRVVAEGLASIPAAVAVGSAFLTVAGTDLAWKQLTDGRFVEWSLSDDRAAPSYRVGTVAGDLQSSDLAVEVSVTSDVTGAIAASHIDLPSFRAVVSAHPSSPNARELAGSDEAERLARAVVAEARTARTTYGATRDTHLFIAGPLGLAMMIGQMLNTFGLVHTYEFISDESGGRYAHAATVRGTR